MRKLALILVSSAICVASAFSAFAGSVPTAQEIAAWEAEQYKYNCDPVAKSEGPTSRAASLVGSDVRQIYSGYGAYGYIWGYTEVQNAGVDAYHYNRVEGKENGSLIASQKEYGYGYVEAETDDITDALHRTIKASVYWGEK